MDEFAMDNQMKQVSLGLLLIHGGIFSTWGSSGGSAACCSRRNGISTGTDTGGSIRQPAALLE